MNGHRDSQTSGHIDREDGRVGLRPAGEPDKPLTLPGASCDIGFPAVFHKTEQGTYEGYFPDLACCYAKGDTLDEALEDAIHSAYDWISLELTEEEPDFPPVSDVADLGKSEGEIARNIAVNIRLFEGWDE